MSRRHASRLNGVKKDDATTGAPGTTPQQKLDRPTSGSRVERRVPVQAASSSCATSDGVLESTEAGGDRDVQSSNKNVKRRQPPLGGAKEGQAKGEEVRAVASVRDDETVGAGDAAAAAKNEGKQKQMKPKRSRGIRTQHTPSTSSTVTKVYFASAFPYISTTPCPMTSQTENNAAN